MSPGELGELHMPTKLALESGLITVAAFSLVNRDRIRHGLSAPAVTAIDLGRR